MISAGIQALDAWLELPGIFNQGAIAGAVDLDNLPLYHYPEISGYYLSYLVCRWRQGENIELIASRAYQIIRCQQALWSGRIAPPTRLYLRQGPLSQSDWRNRGLFSFDVAVLLRGIADASCLWREIPWRAEKLFAWADRFLAEESGLTPVHWLNERPPDAPDSWSTRSGPYQLKAVAGLHIAFKSRRGSGWQESLQPVLVRLVNDFNASRFDRHNPHSVCYAVEGALLTESGSGLNFSVGREWIAKLAGQAISRENQDADSRRSDVIAQLLRLSCCYPFFDPFLASELCKHLMSAIEPDGGLKFTLSPCKSSHKNTWSALFARQALDFYRQVLESEHPLLPEEYACLY